MTRPRIAVIGTGHLGRIHARLLKTIEQIDVVGVADPLAEARTRAEADLGLATFAHHYELIGRIDAAIVATPTPLHHHVALDLLRSGIHCLVEKPICLTTAEADDLIAAARSQKLVLQVGHVERFNPAFAAAATPAEPRYIEARRTGPYSFRSTDVSVVLDLMIHDIDLALSLAGGALVDVQGSGVAVIGPHDDVAEARLTFAGGLVANLFASRASPKPERTLAILGDEKHVSYDLTNRSAQVMRISERVRSGELETDRLSSAEQEQLRKSLFSELLPVETLTASESNAILEEQRDFLAGVQNGRPVRVPGEAGREALAVAEQIMACIAERRADSSEFCETLPLPAAWATNADAAQLRRAG